MEEQIITGTLRKKAKYTSPGDEFFKEQTQIHYFELNLAEMTFGFKKKFSDETICKCYGYKQVLSYTSKLEPEDEKLCEWELGFRVYLFNDKVYILYCENEEELVKWLRGFKIFFEKKLKRMNKKVEVTKVDTRNTSIINNFHERNTEIKFHQETTKETVSVEKTVKPVPQEREIFLVDKRKNHLKAPKAHKVYLENEDNKNVKYNLVYFGNSRNNVKEKQVSDIDSFTKKNNENLMSGLETVKNVKNIFNTEDNLQNVRVEGTSNIQINKEIKLYKNENVEYLSKPNKNKSLGLNESSHMKGENSKEKQEIGNELNIKTKDIIEFKIMLSENFFIGKKTFKFFNINYYDKLQSMKTRLDLKEKQKFIKKIISFSKLFKKHQILKEDWETQTSNQQINNSMIYNRELLIKEIIKRNKFEGTNEMNKFDTVEKRTSPFKVKVVDLNDKTIIEDLDFELYPQENNNIKKNPVTKQDLIQLKDDAFHQELISRKKEQDDLTSSNDNNHNNDEMIKVKAHKRNSEVNNSSEMADKNWIKIKYKENKDKIIKLDENFEKFPVINTNDVITEEIITDFKLIKNRNTDKGVGFTLERDADRGGLFESMYKSSDLKNKSLELNLSEISTTTKKSPSVNSPHFGNISIIAQRYNKIDNIDDWKDFISQTNKSSYTVNKTDI
jgi:hypothetical protein